MSDIDDDDEEEREREVEEEEEREEEERDRGRGIVDGGGSGGGRGGGGTKVSDGEEIVYELLFRERVCVGSFSDRCCCFCCCCSSSSFCFNCFACSLIFFRCSSFCLRRSS